MPKAVIVAVAAYYAGAAIAGALGLGASGFGAAIFGVLIAYGLATMLAPSYKQSMGTGQQGTLVTRREAIGTWRIVYGRTRLGGNLTYMEMSEDNHYLHMIITLSGNVLTAIDKVFFNEDELTLDGNGDVTAPAKYVGAARIKKSLGSEAGQPFPDLVAESAGLWTNDHKQRGRGKLYIRLAYNANAFPYGVPNVNAIVNGKAVYDPRTATTVFSANPALIFADYLTDTTYGVGASYANEIDEAALIAAANICDENVALLSGGLEDRYTLNGVITTDRVPSDVIASMLTAMAGRITYVAGRWRIVAGAYIAPTLELTQDDLRGPIKLQPRLSKRDLFNGVRGEYITTADNVYQPTEFPVVTNAAYVTYDNNEKMWLVMSLPFTHSAATAQRIAKIELERCRQQISVQLHCKLGTYRLQPSDTFMLTLDKYSFAQKVFEVVDVRFVVESNILGVDILARETASTVYAWSTSDETAVGPVPDVNLPDAFVVGVPGAPTVVESMYEAIGSGSVKVAALVSWTITPDWFTLSGLSIYQLEYKLVSASDWVVVTNIKSSDYTILDFPPGLYHFRVKAYNTLGVSGAYSGITQHEIVGLTAAPSNIQNFSVHPIAGVAQLTWGLHVDTDVRIGGKIEVRHSTDVSSGTWFDSSLLGRYDGLSTGGIAPLLIGQYMAKARDSSNVYSSSAAAFFASEAVITGFTTVSSVVEQTTFVGTKVNLQVTGSRLELTNPSSLVGTYFFPGSKAATPSYLDVGSVASRRLVSILTMQRFDASDLIDSRGPVDDWSTVDGGAVEAGEATLYARLTDDNPSGAPTWGAWTVFRVADFRFRAAQFKMEYATDSSTHNVSISELAVHVKV